MSAGRGCGARRPAGWLGVGLALALAVPAWGGDRSASRLLTDGAGGSSLFASLRTPPDLPEPAPDAVLAALDLTQSPARGPADAPVVIVGYSDFACPWCAAAVPNLEALLRRYPAQVRWVYKHYPLDPDPATWLAHRVALAAGAQGRFWEMHDALLAHRGELSPGAISTLAAGLGLDPVRLAEDAARLEPTRIAADRAEGETLGVAGTPTFFVNGRRLVGNRGVGELTALVEAELDRDRALAGVPDQTAEALGPADAPLQLTVYADFQSPQSARLAWWLRRELAAHPDLLRVTVKHYPLPYHRDADGAHRAALAAGIFGRFWAMHDLLFAQPGQVDEARIRAYAMQLGLPAARFDTERGGAAMAARIAADIADGKRRGVRGVPTLFVNGERFDGIPDPARWQALLSAAAPGTTSPDGPIAAAITKSEQTNSD